MQDKEGAGGSRGEGEVASGGTDIDVSGGPARGGDESLEEVIAMLATALSCRDEGRAMIEEHARRFRTLARVGQDVAGELGGDCLKNQAVMSAFFHQFYRVMAEAAENTGHHVNWEYLVLNTKIPFALRARGGWTSLARSSGAPRLQRRLSSEVSTGRPGEKLISGG